MIIKKLISFLLLILLEKAAFNLYLQIMENLYSWFESPDFEKNQQLLKEQNKLLTSTMSLNKKDPFDLGNVFDSKNAIQDMNLKVPLLDKTKQFEVFRQNNPIEESPFEVEKKGSFFSKIGSLLGNKTDASPEEVASTGNAVQQGFSFGMDTFKTLNTTNSGDADGIMNTLNLGMQGVQLGMTVGGPVGAAIGGATGAVIGIADTISDFGKVERQERKANQIKKEKMHTKLEQEQRQKDGLNSLQNLTQLRKQQESFMI